MCEECQKHQATISRRACSPAAPAHIPRAVSNVLRSPGHPLDSSTRAFFEPRFGRDLGSVRIHTGTEAAASARSIQAHAYTAGSDIVFASGQYAPETEQGRRLLAHELTHTIQSSGRADQTTLQRDEDSNSPSGADVFDPEAARAEAIADEKESMQPDKAFGLRLQLVLAEPSAYWKNQKEFDQFYDESILIADDELKTIDYLNNPQLTTPEAFPQYWAGKIRTAFVITDQRDFLQKEVANKKQELSRSGELIPGTVFQHGLPFDFAASTRIHGVLLASQLGVAFQWLSIPGGGTIVSGYSSYPAFVDFTGHAVRYLRALNDSDYFFYWIQSAEIVAKQIENGDFTVDPEAYDRFTKDHPRGVTEAEMISPINLKPLDGRIDPAVAITYIDSVTGLITYGLSFMHGQEVTAEAAQVIEAADALIGNQDPQSRVMIALQWGHELGFYGDAMEQQWDDFKEHWKEEAKGMAEDTALFTVLQFIPGVDVIVDIYLAAQLIGDIAGTIGDLNSADEEARQATTAAALQHASAMQATALSAAARKVATAVAAGLATHYGAKAAKKIGGKITDWATKDTSAGDLDNADTPEGQGKTEDQSNGKNKDENSGGTTSKDPETQRVTGEPPEPLEKGGYAGVSEEGLCKICHSPCKFQVDLAREVADAVRNTKYAGYAENLMTRIHLLDEAMETAVKRGTMKVDFPSRFRGAFKKLSSEIEAAHRRFIGEESDISLPAADEIEGFESRRQGDLDNPNNFDYTRWAERGNEGTAYHDRIESAVVDSLPRDRAFTENTIQDFFKKMDVDSKMFPKKSTGIDLYIVDASRGLVIPVDIVGTAGGKAHVAKLHVNVADIKEAFKQVGLHMSEPIEIEYAGKTFDEAAASVIAELKPFAR